jgi:hypothetical protein
MILDIREIIDSKISIKYKDFVFNNTYINKICLEIIKDNINYDNICNFIYIDTSLSNEFLNFISDEIIKDYIIKLKQILKGSFTEIKCIKYNYGIHDYNNGDDLKKYDDIINNLITIIKRFHTDSINEIDTLIKYIDNLLIFLLVNLSPNLVNDINCILYFIIGLFLIINDKFKFNDKNMSTNDKEIIYNMWENKYQNIYDETDKILNELFKKYFTEKSHMKDIFKYILETLELINTTYKLYIRDYIPEQVGFAGGSKDTNIIDIRKTYDLYYSTNTDDLIIELLEILGTNENVIYFLLIINTSLANFFEDLNKLLIDFYNTDILLSYYYNENEIIYYIFLNYIYNNYKSLLSLSLSLSSNDIIINIGKIKSKEKYNEIYKKIEELFKNPEIISKLILFIKSHLKIPETIRHPNKIKDVEYLLLFIYKYSKKDEKVIIGYDSFLTYIYLNLLNKFNKTPKIKIDNLPTFNIYNFTNLSKTYYFELSSSQDQLCNKLMKDVKLLISLIS